MHPEAKKGGRGGNPDLKNQDPSLSLSLQPLF
jgi:hypothetical protein